ncbi:E3 ubiquitin ligase interacting with arginine methyltransferase [Phaffia rhodozyma]|uniref:E3 ubiquitin ligase interacting with arginine methyltransferase n=1 Tax=Phaffia rhodozyma TaxID=264483 RepID=A0A0F7SJA5_PHARH|nr:E3 ubiquitin ligase interacting with arginine methyltransferase [Phaffia rhodozyma]
MVSHFSRKRKPSSQKASPAPKRLEKQPGQPIVVQKNEPKEVIDIDTDAVDKNDSEVEVIEESPVEETLEEGEIEDDLMGGNLFVVDTAGDQNANRASTSSPVSKPASTLPPPSSVSTPIVSSSPGSPVDSSLFFVDIAPQTVKKNRAWETEPVVTSTANATGEQETTADGASADTTGTGTDGLILPDHITLEVSAPTVDREQGEAAPLTEAEVFADELIKIEFLDGEDKQITRYFDTVPDGEEFGSGGKASIVCNICKQRGHTQRECKQEVCLTCGAIDEHSTRSCPVALTCFNCGQRGHRVKDCPAPKSQRYNRYGGGNTHCDRCGADTHLSNNCPTLWRIYSYLTLDDRRQMLEERQHLKREGGFEGDVLEADPDGDEDGSGDWCYNCARDGHFGDDCPQYRSSRIPIVDYSAFSSYNASNSPFWTPSTSSTSNSSRPSKHTRFNSGSTSEVPDMMENVGRRGKERERERNRAYEKTRRREDEGEDEDEDDWFNRSKSSKPSTSAANGISIKGKSRDKENRSEKRDRKSDRSHRDRDDDRHSSNHTNISSRRVKDRSEKREKKKRRKSKDGPESDDSPRPYVSGGTGTELEAEYLQENPPYSRKSGGGSSASSTGLKRGFSFKFNAGNDLQSTPASGIQPSILRRMGMDSPQAPSSPSASNSSGSGPDKSKYGSLKSKGGGGDSLSSSSMKKSERRDAARKDRERDDGVKAMLDRFNGKGRMDYLDSPDRRPRGEGTGGGAGTPTTGRSKYAGGYR